MSGFSVEFWLGDGAVAHSFGVFWLDAGGRRASDLAGVTLGGLFGGVRIVYFAPDLVPVTGITFESSSGFVSFCFSDVDPLDVEGSPLNNFEGGFRPPSKHESSSLCEPG